VIPIVNRNGQAAAKNNLRGMDLTTWDSNLWKLAYWYRTG
jgi:peptide/nickel transport system substrate-binding protein